MNRYRIDELHNLICIPDHQLRVYIQFYNLGTMFKKHRDGN